MTTINQRRQALTQLIQERLDVLSERKSPSDIARELGWKSDRTICLYAAGETFVPLDHAIPLARGLELDPGPFFRAALECFMQLPEELHITFEPATIAPGPADRTICLYAAGETFVPLDHAIPLARGLELDPGPFFRAALECFMQLPEELHITFEPATIAPGPAEERACEEPGRC